MKRIFILPVIMMILSTHLSCTFFISPREQRIKDVQRALIETDERVVKDCQYLGTVHGTVDVGNTLLFYSKERCRNKAKQNAAVLGATHIVWLYTHKTSAAALAYKCEVKQSGKQP